MHTWSPSDFPGGILASSSTWTAKATAKKCSRTVVTTIQYIACIVTMDRNCVFKKTILTLSFIYLVGDRILLSGTNYTVVVIRVSPKGMDKLDDKLVCTRWEDERKTTTDKGCQPTMVAMLGSQLERCISLPNKVKAFLFTVISLIQNIGSTFS